jgi:hypothetical protein
VVGFTDPLKKNVRPAQKSLAEERAVNRPLTEHAQFVNQSGPPEHRTASVIAKNGADAADRFGLGLREAR